jgi:ABC-type antimicrobial peptide transport system permease subunit
VARDSKYINVYEDPLPYFYIAMAQEPSLMWAVYVRSAAAPQDLIPRVLRVIHELDPEIPVADVRTMHQTMTGSLGYMVFRLSAVQAVAMGVLGLLLSVVGVYGVVSYVTSQRMREIGIRIALGASPRNIRALVFGEGARLVGAGLLLGLLVALAVTTAMARVFFLVEATELTTFAAVTCFLTVVVLAACYQPARRATRVDPIVVLRQD